MTPTTERAHHKLIGIELPPRIYAPRDAVVVPDPWDKRMVLTFNTFLNPQMVGTVVMTVREDEGQHIPEASQFLGEAKTINGRTIILWTRLTLPNGKVAWQPPKPRQASR